MTLSSNEERIKRFLYLAFTVAVFCMHLPMQYFNDDLTVLPSIESKSLWDFFLLRFYSNGKIFTDVLANFFYRFPLIFWKLFDTAVYLLIALLIVKTFSDNTWQDVLTTCILISLFPFWYMSTAGWVATTTNYLYPMLCLLVVASCVKQLANGRLPSIPEYICAACCILYAANQDQAAMIMVGGLLLVLLYCAATKASRNILTRIGGLLGFTVVCYLILFMIPGHIYRMRSTAEMSVWLPEYADWSIFKKIYRAYTSTVATLFFHNVKLFDIFCFLLLLSSAQSQKAFQKIVASIPFFVVLISRLIGCKYFVVYPSYAGGMPELAGFEAGWPGIAIVLVTVCAVLSIFYTVFVCIPSQRSKWLILLFLILGAGSRLMMGFSATLYASHARTFTFFVYMLILSNLTLLKELRKENSPCYYIGIGTMIAAMLYIPSPLYYQQLIIP